MKLLLKIVAAILILLLVAILALVFFFDLNFLKPRIEASARDQGVDLRIGGDLGWTFWPSLGVSVGDIRVAALSAPDAPIAQLTQASLRVALRPLFRGDIQVHHVQVDGAVIELAVDEQGKGNWEALGEEKPAEPSVARESSTEPEPAPSATASDESSEAQSFSLAVERISLSNSALRYRDAKSGQSIAVEDVNLDIRQFNLQGQPFDLTLALSTRLANDLDQSQPLVVAAELANRAQFAEDFSSLSLSQGSLKLRINQRASLSATYELKASELQTGAHYSGELRLPAFDARALLAALGSPLETRNKQALTQVGLELRFAGDPRQLTLEPLSLQLDKTRFQGKLAIADLETQALQVVLKGDKINVDDYLAPESAEEPVPASASSGDEVLIPLESLRTLKADARIEFDEVVFAATPLQDVRVRLTADRGLLALQQADAQLYEGHVKAKANLDARGDTAVIRFDSKVESVQLAPALKNLELDKSLQFAGAVNADATANLRGVTMNQLLDSLTAEVNFSGAEWRFAPLNVEQKFCELVNLVNKVESDPTRAWDAFTDMRAPDGRITMANRVVTVESFSAGVHQLLMGTQGKLNLATDEYDFTLPLKLLQEETSEKGCRVASNYWIDRSLSLLRCKGSLESVNPIRDCRPDSKGLASLTKDLAEYKLREKHGDKIDAAEQKLDDKKEELLKKLDEKLGGEGDSKRSRDLLKGLLKQSTQKSSEADAASSEAADN